MAGDQYKAHSKHQYAAHDGCYDLLVGCVKRLQSRMLQEEASSSSMSGPLSSRRWQIADLGSADGSNAMITMRKAIDIIKIQKEDDDDKNFDTGSCHHLCLPARLHLTFGEHPASDEELLRKTCNDHNAWFQEHDITHSVLMKSFYESLFPPSSVDLFLSYICLHWLDTSTTGVTSDGGTATTTMAGNVLHDWKRGKIPSCVSSSIRNSGITDDEHDDGNDDDDDDDEVLTKFVYMNEMTTPKALQEKFRLELARVHLARFLALRARELRPGGEAIVMMVSRPHDWIRCPAATIPVSSSSCTTNNDCDDAYSGAGHIPSPLLTGMQQCVEQGLLRKEVVQRTLVPYYLRTTQDVVEALDLARTFPISEDNDNDDKVIYPGSWLELVEMRHYPVNLSGGVEGNFELMWAIHKSSIVAAGPTEAELESIRQRVKKVYCDSLGTKSSSSSSSSSSLSSQKGGETVFYLACVVRRREDT
jgi:hypothetical protein